MTGGPGASHRLAPAACRAASAADDAQLLALDGHDVPGVKLAAPACVGLAVDQHVAGSERCLRFGAGGHDPLELEQLAEADRLVADGHVAHGRTVAPRPRRAADGLRWILARRGRP